MTDHDALLAAVKAAPDDDYPRLVYADALEDAGRFDHAEKVRTPTPGREHLRWRTKVGRGWFRYANDLLAGVVPKTWSVWPVPLPSVQPRGKVGGEDMTRWPVSEGTCTFRSSRPYYVVGLRHGFISSVAAPFRRLVKTLPRLVAVQPVVEVAVTELFLEFEDYCRPDRSDAARTRRTIRFAANNVPTMVWDRLTPETWDGFHDVGRTYPNLTAAYDDLSRALLSWARDTARV